MLPLGDITVIDLSRNIAGPLCAMLLGDLGAEVIKIERPDGGDEARNHAERGGTSPYFGSLNRNKRSVALDLKSQPGTRALAALLQRADVLVDNLRPGALHRLGFGDERLRREHPALVVCHISGFGPTGPWADAPAYDQIIQGFSGLMSLTGPPDAGGHRVGASIADVTTGLFASSAILAALRRRDLTAAADGDSPDRSGGAILEVSLLASLLNVLGYHAATYLTTGEAPAPLGNQHPYIAPYGTFATAAGAINLCIGNDRLFGKLCQVLGLSDIPADERFATNALRLRHRDALNAALERALAARPAAEWIERLRAAGVPCGPVHSLAQALAHPQTAALDLIAEVPDERGGRQRQLRLPFTSSGWEMDIRRPPPALGADTEEVLGELGLERPQPR